MKDQSIEFATEESTRWWKREIHRFHGLQVHPVRKFEEDGHWYCEQCEPEEADFWSVYGQFNGGMVECFEDFDTEAEAQTFAERIYATYPNLNLPSEK